MSLPGIRIVTQASVQSDRDPPTMQVSVDSRVAILVSGTMDSRCKDPAQNGHGPNGAAWREQSQLIHHYSYTYLSVLLLPVVCSISCPLRYSFTVDCIVSLVSGAEDFDHIRSRSSGRSTASEQTNAPSGRKFLRKESTRSNHCTKSSTLPRFSLLIFAQTGLLDNESERTLIAFVTLNLISCWNCRHE